MDAILYWNDVCMEVQRRDFTPAGGGDATAPGVLAPEVGGPTRVSRAFGIVHAAMYDAVALSNAASGLAVYAPAGINLPAATAVNTDGAVAGAAVIALQKLWPGQSAFIAGKLVEFINMAAAVTGTFPNPVIAPFHAGQNFGEQIGQEMIRYRSGDGADRVDEPDFYPAPGHHQKDPFQPKQARLSTHWGRVQPFCLVPTIGGKFVDHKLYLDAPPQLNSARYTDAVKDVSQKGRARSFHPVVAAPPAPYSAERTPNETATGIFWGYDGSNGLGVPPRLYNQVVRQFLLQNANPALTTAENARLFARIHCGMADAAIVAWGAKYDYDLWRPVIGIRQSDPGFGPNHGSGAGASTPTADPTWAPLGIPRTNIPGEFFRTPDFPAYPSGHATFGATAMRVTALFLAAKTGKKEADILQQGLDFVSDEFNGVNVDPAGDVRVPYKHWSTLGQVIIDNALSRVYLGVHWRFDGLGTKVPAVLNIAGITLPPDPAAPNALPNEEKIGGVGAGLIVADQVTKNSFL